MKSLVFIHLKLVSKLNTSSDRSDIPAIMHRHDYLLVHR